MASTFQAMICKKFAPFVGMRDEDMDINTMITSFSTALTDSASGYFGRNVAGTSHGSSKMFSTSVMRGEI